MPNRESGDCGREPLVGAVGLAPLVPDRNKETRLLWYAGDRAEYVAISKKKSQEEGNRAVAAEST